VGATNNVRTDTPDSKPEIEDYDLLQPIVPGGDYRNVANKFMLQSQSSLHVVCDLEGSTYELFGGSKEQHHLFSEASADAAREMGYRGKNPFRFFLHRLRLWYCADLRNVGGQAFEKTFVIEDEEGAHEYLRIDHIFLIAARYCREELMVAAVANTGSAVETSLPNETPSDIQRETIAVPILVKQSEVKYMFRRDGDQWEMVFDGKSNKYSDTFGMRYINLLVHSSKPVSVQDIEAITNRGRGPGEDQRNASSECHEEGLHEESVQYATDESEIKEKRLQLTECRRRLEAAPLNSAEYKEMNRAVEFLQEWFVENTAGGKPRRASHDPGEKARQRITQAFNKAFDRIERNDQAAANYLRKQIKVNARAGRYDQPDSIEWA
jgi:hypothetical protein